MFISRIKCRIRDANGQTLVHDIVEIFICEISVFNAAPILEIIGICCAFAHWYNATLDSTVSIASMMISGLQFGILFVSKNILKTSTWISGFISLTRCMAILTLGCPIVEFNAKSCRFILDSSITSKSTKIKCPTPVRANASIAKDPTAPQPTTTASIASSAATP